jgi:maltoporin
LWIAALASCCALPAEAQTSEDLLRQLQQLKDQYEATTASLAFEAGLDHTRSGTGRYEGWLEKFTLAPQFGAGRKFFSRPVLRTFVTYANWSDGLRGFVGGVPYSDKTQGFTYGVQAETWW